MENNNMFTLFDEMMQTREQQMLKSMLPFLEGNQRQKVFYLILYMQIMQSRQVLSPQGALCAQSLPTGTERICAILNTIKDYCNPKERETLETIQNFMCLFDNYDAFTG